MRTSIPFTILVVLATLATQKQAKAVNQTTVPVPAVFVFGDSIVDSGNNNNLITVAKCNFPPYGRDFVGRRPTGRFSNGKIPTDFIVSLLGIKEFMPAYLDPQLTVEDLMTGVSFASGGSGYDNLTSHVASVYTMWQQLQLFEDYKRKLQLIAGADRAAKIVDQGAYIIFSGSNDLFTTYFSSSLRKRDYDLPSYLSYMVDSASKFIKDLHSLGARRIGIAGLPPLGCMPEARTLAGGFTRACSSLYNQASARFNTELASEMERLNTALPGSRIVYMDVYSPLLELILSPHKYGFQEATRGCCGTGRYEASVLCNNLNPFTCRDTSTYVFWDSFHPTQRANEILIPQLVQKYLHLIL